MKIVFSPLVTKLSGKLSNYLIQGGQYCNIMREYNRPDGLNFANIYDCSKSFYYASKRFYSLNCDNREAWNLEASTGRWGYYEGTLNPLSGFHAYTKLFAFLIDYYRSGSGITPELPETPPSTTYLPPIVSLTGSYYKSDGVFEILPDSSQEFIEDTIILVYSSIPLKCLSVNPSLKFYFTGASLFESLDPINLSDSIFLSHAPCSRTGNFLMIKAILLNLNSLDISLICNSYLNIVV